MIVILTHSDLCNESLMADEAFALSPISARPAMPSDADYDAIREAFMETSRGRWFLSEYAKRNRNADTHMVLDAVARIEKNLAGQKQPIGPSLSESLIAIRAVVGEARAGVAKAIAGLENDAVLAAAHDGARIIREVSWTLRECGADIRICNLLDTQLSAIDAGHRLVADVDSEAALATFDRLLDRIHELAGEARMSPGESPIANQDEPAFPTADGELPEAAAAIEPAAESVTEAPEPTAVAELVAVAAPDAAAAPETMATPEATAAPDATATPEAMARPEATPESELVIVTAAETDGIEFVEPMATPADVVPTTSHHQSAAVAETSEAQTASEDEAADVDAMLDLIATEMSAPQPPEPGELEAAIAAAQADAEQTAEAALDAAERSEIEQLAAEVAIQQQHAEEAAGLDAAAAPSIDVSTFEIGERGEPLHGTQHAAQPIMAAAATMSAQTPAPGATASLGAALIASGVVAQPSQPRSDPLAPLRRMSQAEKVAFFS